MSDYDYGKVINRYEFISALVNKLDLSEYNPEIFAQGSFKLGTVIKQNNRIMGLWCRCGIGGL